MVYTVDARWQIFSELYRVYKFDDSDITGLIQMRAMND